MPQRWPGSRLRQCWSERYLSNDPPAEPEVSLEADKQPEAGVWGLGSNGTENRGKGSDWATLCETLIVKWVR